MITRAELREYAKTLSLNLGQAEKDYFQGLVLFILYLEYGKDLVFKGGTALKKCYGLDRFSEDLDFTCLKKPEIKKLDSGLNRFNLEHETELEDYPDGLKAGLRIKGPLYAGSRMTLCKIVLDFSFREKPVLKPEVKNIGWLLKEIPSFDVLVMAEKEILAEKIRAITSRDKARDVYDLSFMLNKGVAFDAELVNEKMKYYGQQWSREEFIKKLGRKERIWETELKPLVPKVPNYRETRDYILSRI